MNLALVPPHLIPKGAECPLNDLVYLLQLAISMEILCDHNQGVGLSAVQVGIPLNFFIVKYGNESSHHFRYFVNCKYEPLSNEKITGVEGCLSLRKESGELRFFEVERFKSIKIIGKELVTEPTLSMVDLVLQPIDFYGIVYQHEIDHAYQVLISEIGKEVHLWSK